MIESVTGLKQLLRETGISEASEISARLLAYLALLEKWNPRINLTSTTDWSRLRPLFHEAIWASKFYPENAIMHLDIGSGAGFPAILLWILNPQIQLEMIESRTKRCVFLETIANSMGAGKIHVHNTRLNEFLEDCDDDRAWDCVSWKALKLNESELKLMEEHSHAQTQFWMFHGRDLAVEHPAVFEKGFKLVRKEAFEGDKAWFLSIFRLRS